MPNITVVPALEHHRVDDADFIALCTVGKISLPAMDVGPRYHISVESLGGPVSNEDMQAIVASFCPWTRNVLCRVRNTDNGRVVVHMFTAPPHTDLEAGNTVVLDGID